MAKKIEYATTAEIKVGNIIQARLDGRAIKVENIETITCQNFWRRTHFDASALHRRDGRG
jgi:hypothetical protein